MQLNFSQLINLATSLPGIFRIIDTAPTTGTAAQRLSALFPSLLPILEELGAGLFPQLAPLLHGVAGATSLHKVAVIGIQEALNIIVKPTPLLGLDGLLGPKTKSAIMALQSKYGLPTTGFLADAEWALIQNALAKIP